MIQIPKVGDWRRFPWDAYTSRWFVAAFATPFHGRTVVILQRENRPNFSDRAEITLEMWNTGSIE